MRQVYSNSELCHVWSAHNTTDPNGTPHAARNSHRSMFYEGDSIYSYGYHFLSAKFYSTARGPVVLINSDRYSNSTAKQLGHVRRAVTHLETFYVTDPNNPRTSLEDSATAITETLFNTFSRLRPEWDWDWLPTRIKKHNDMCVVFDCMDLTITIPDDLKEIIQEYVDYRRAKNEIKDAKILEQKRLAEIQRQKELDVQRFEDRAQLIDWLNGVEGVRVPNSYSGWNYNRRAFIRIKGDMVETSQGASVPLRKARVLSAYLARGEDQKLLGQSIGYYKIDAVVRPTRSQTASDLDQETPHVEIGCHRIDIAHILSVLKPLTTNEESN